MRAAAGIVLALLVVAGPLASGRRALQPAAAASRSGKAAPFDSGRAYEHVRQLVAIGPRPAGSPGNAQARRYILDQAKGMGLTGVEQPFDASTPFGPVKMANVVVTVPGTGPGRMVIGGHFDTKLFRQFRFVGANDGGSSAAMVLELARALKGRANAHTMDFVFFDGEEATLPEWSGKDNTYGSRFYVEDAARRGTLKDIRAMLLVDMIGDRDLAMRREARSTKWLTDVLWTSAKRLGHGQHFVEESEPIEDDHLNFLDAGVQAVDLIDLRYDAWHTAEDTIDKVSARSLQVVGDVILDALPAIEKGIAAGKK